MSLPKVQEYMKTDKILHKRSLYKNIYMPSIMKDLPKDVKINRHMPEDSKSRMEICGWISVYNNQVKNPTFKVLNSLLTENFPNKCKYEV